MACFHTIVAAVDFSETSADVLETAREMARLHRARLHVVHVVGDPFQAMYAVETTGLDLPDVLRQWTEAAGQRLAALLEAYPIESGRLTTSIMTGSPAHEIVRYAAEQDADLILLGTHGRGMVGRVLLGSVADRVLHHAGRAVLVVPHSACRATTLEVNAAAAVGS
jgi:nucleotide-binding universal stress UspA family protein